jgi:hypothetical protein
MSVAIEQFIHDVRTFCQWVEGKEHGVSTVRQLLLSLMRGISHLPAEDRSEDRTHDYPCRGYEGWKADFERLTDLPFHLYRMVYSPLDIEDEESLVNDLRDDLADIYGDLRYGIAALDAGDDAYAFEHWRESYTYHWGHHASAAMRALDEHYRETMNGEPVAPHEPPPRASVSDAPDDRTLDSLPAPGSSGGR